MLEEFEWKRKKWWQWKAHDQDFAKRRGAQGDHSQGAQDQNQSRAPQWTEQEAASSSAPGSNGFGGSDASVGSKRKFDAGVEGEIVGKGAGVRQHFLQGKGKYGAEASFSHTMSGGKGGDSTQGGPAKKAKT